MAGEAEPGKAKAAGIVGILIGAMALINLVCGFIYVALGGPDGAGLYNGFGQVVICSLGIVAWVKLSKGAMIGYLVMSILWLIVTIVAEVIALIAWLIWYIIRKVVEENCVEVGDHCVCNAEKQIPFTVHNCSDIVTIENCFIAMVAANAIATILIFAASIIGCMGTCCAKQTTTNVVVVQQPGMVMQQQGNAQPPPEYPEKY